MIRLKRQRWIPAVEACGVVLFAALLLLLAGRVVSALRSPLAWAMLAAAAPIGYLLSDFASGVAHWFCDTFFEEDTPLVGRLVIASFREHHRAPEAMTGHGFLELNGNNCLALVPLLGAAAGLGGPAPGSGASIFAHATLLFFTLGVFATNQFHRWAHDREAPRFAQWLQRHGLILRPGHHASHHAPPHTAAYCVTTGWMNRLLEPIGFFPACARALIALGFPRSRR